MSVPDEGANQKRTYERTRWKGYTRNAPMSVPDEGVIPETHLWAYPLKQLYQKRTYERTRWRGYTRNAPIALTVCFVFVFCANIRKVTIEILCSCIERVH